MFAAVGHFGFYEEVRSAAVNAADAAAGRVADIECFDASGNIVLAAEAKDQVLTLKQVAEKIENARNKKVSEVLFLANRGVEDTEQIDAVIARELPPGRIFT